MMQRGRLWPRLAPFGESAWLVTLPGRPGPAMTARLQAMSAALEGVPGVRAIVPGMTTLLIQMHPGSGKPTLPDPAQSRLAGRPRDIPVVYGGNEGPDLDAVAQCTGLAPDQVIRLHSRARQTVLLIGFSPGFPYLGPLPKALHLPRRATPRATVPAGSVAIAGGQTGIYPRATPGGWHIIGRTPVTLFDPERNPPAYLSAGDRVRFRPISARDWEHFHGVPADW